MNKQKTAALALAALALGASQAASARGENFPDSYIGISGGGGDQNLEVGGASSGKVSGTSYGAEGRLAFGKAFVADASYEQYKGSQNGTDVDADRMEAALGFMVSVGGGGNSSLLLEGLYTGSKLKPGGADYSKHGFGIKTGFVVPVGEHFITSGIVELAHIQASGGQDSQGLASFIASAGYKITRNWGIHAVYRRDAYEGRSESPGQVKFYATAYRGMISYSF
ncbi:MAG TPA: hypothetical protein VHE37_01760 [Nevskiaceae bacterium]|nr:hypothetical protein [Nevskiaceae bacterium]